MSHESKGKDRQSKYRDQNGSSRSSMPRWTDMGNVNDGYGGYEYMDPWGKMGLKYAPQYYHNEPRSRYADPSENSSSSGDTDSYVQNEKPIRKRLHGRKLALIVIVVGLVAIAAAITVILVLSLKPAESQPNKFRVVTMSLAVAETFKPEYKNQSSSEYKSFAGNFTSAMDEIFQANNTKGYKGIQIVELKNGSVIVIFIVVIEFKQSEGPPGEEVLKTVITGQKNYENDNNNVVVKNFKILKGSISIVKTEEFASNPISTTAGPSTISTTTTKATTTTSITSPPSQGQDNFSVATVNLAVDDTFKPEYYNTSSVEYQIFAADFTNAMDKIFNTTEGYKGSQIKELKTGSVIVIFIIVIEVKSNVKPLGEEELKAVITGQKRDTNDNITVVIERFRILTTSVSIVAIDKVKFNPIFPTDDSTTTKSSTPATTFPPSTSTTVKANVTASTSASNVQLNSSTTPSTLAVSTPPTPTSSTLQPSTTTTSTSTITTTTTTTITSPNTTVQKAISTTILTSLTTPIVTISIATTQTSLGPGTISTSNASSATTLTSTTANTTSPNTQELKGNSTTVYSSTSKPMSTIYNTSLQTIEHNSTTTTLTSPATTTPATSISTSQISQEPNATNVIISTSSTISTSTKIITSSTKANEPNTTTTTSTSTTITKPTTTTTSPKIPELSTTSFIPSTISTTLSNSPTSTMATTTASTTTTAANVPRTSLSSTEPNPTSTTTSISTTSLKSTTISTTTPKYIETISTTATTAASTTQSSIIAYNTTSPKPDEANMTRTTLSTTKLSIKPAINSTTWSNNPTSVMPATTTSALTTAANGITPIMSSTKPPEPNTTSTTTPTSAKSSETTSTTPAPTSSLKSTITSTISTKSPEPSTTTATTSASRATSIKTTLSTTNEPNTTTTTSTLITITKPTNTTTSPKLPELSTTSFIPSTISTTLSKYPASTMASTTASNTTTAAYVTTPNLSSNNFSEPNPTSTTTWISTTSLKSTTISTTTPKYIETISTTATTATSTMQSSIITYSTTSPKPDEANMTRTTLSTTKLSIKPATNSTTWSNNPTSVWTATTSSTLTTTANVTTLSMSSTKPPEPNTTSATTTTSATRLTITSTTPTPTTSLKSNITSTVSTKSPEPTATTATTTESIATSIKTTLSTTSPKPTETNLTNTTASTSTTNLSPITTSIVLPNITELNTTITSTSTSTTTLMPKTTSTFVQPTSEPNATNASTWTTTYTTKPSSAIPSTMATTNSSTVSTVLTNSTMGPSSTSYKTIAATSTTPKGVAFNTKYYTAVVGVSLELMCTVTSWNGNLSVSRLSRTNQQEITVVNFVNNKTGTILNGFAVNITFTGYNVDVSIFILNTSCEDEGTYYCTTGAVTDNATVKRKRDKPILQLPDIMIRDNYHNIKYPFLCETDIDDSGEILIAEVNQNGTFYLYAGYAESRVNITTDCGNKQRFTFYINGRFTSVWDNAKIRCVLINNSTNGHTGIRLVSEESTIQLIRADICISVTQGSNVSYPQSNCELFVTCLDSGPVPGKCKQGQCFYDNIGMCRAPICPFVYCNDADASIGEPISITCSLLFCNDSFSLTIKHLGDTLFSSNNITGNISQRSEERDIQVSLTNGKAELTVSFLKTNCNHSGEYIIILGRENVTDRGYLTFKVPPKRPTLLLPQYIVAYTQATITCSGEQGIPRQNMYIEVMFKGSNYTKYENTILTTDDKNCSSMGTLVMNFLVVEKWQHARVRCVIGDNSSSRLESDVYEINTTSSGIIISPSEITGFINDTVQINCTVTGILSNDSVIISRFIPTIQGEEILSILIIGNSIQNNLTWIRFSTTVLSDNNMIIHITINFLQCRDGGTYRCKTGNRTAIASLAILSKPDKPSLMLPQDIVSDGYNQAGDPFVCKGNVGYPGGNLLAQIKSNGTFKEVQPFKVNLIRGNISNCQKVDILEFYLDKFTMDLHNSTLRCVATNNVTIAFGQTDPYDEKVLLLVPGTTCYGKANGLTLPYPYPFDDCKKYVFCTENRTFVKNGGCQDGECYYTDMKRCEQERTTTTIAPTTTTKLTCPFLYCRDTDVNLGDSASITCEILYCNDSFSLSIKHSEDTIFSNVNISGNISMKSDDKDIQILVSRGAVVVTLTINKTNCSHTGEYIIDLDRGTFIDRAALRLKVPPKKPILQLPQSFVADTDTTIYCTGEQGVPQQAMYMEVMFNSGNFSKYDKTTLTRNSQNCSNMGTLAMHILVEDIWDGARIRCVIGDNSTSRMESEVHAINITYPGVRFSSTKFTGLINGTVQMNCTVNGVFNGDNIIISRSNSASLAEETLSIITVGNSTKSNHTGLQIGITNLSANDMIVHVNMDSLQCHEGGTYHCKTGNRTAATKLEIWRKPDKPKLKLPVDVISDGYNQAGDPFVCEGNVGYPGGNLTVLFNKDGNFNDAKPFKANMTTGNVTECGRVDKFEFYLNKFTTDLHNTTVRCVATNTNTLSGESAPFEDKVLLLVPGDKCYGVPEDLNLPYPYSSYDCGKYLYCSWNRTFVKDGGCKYGECYYTDMKRCEQERTTTTTKPTTTTQVACPSVTCSGAEPVINSNATITCVLILCGDLFDLIIELDSNVQFRETMRGNRTYPFLSNALLSLIVVDNNTAKLNIGFQNIMCNQSGAYNVSIYGGNVSSVAAIRVTVNSEKPNITAPRNIYKDQKAIISCIGQLGIPTASMFWQLKLPGGNFESYSVNGSPDIYKSDCSVIGNWIIGIYPEQSWNGGGIRCGTKTQGNPSSEIYSDAIAITLEEPDIYFVPSSSSGYIGSSHSITCIARHMANITSVKIERQTISGLHEVAHLNIDGTSQTNFIGIRIRNTSMINSTAANVYMDFDNLTCVDKGDYFCTIGAFSSRGDLIVLRLPEVPQMVTFPTSGILQNTASGTINCTGEVGYPARKIVFESNKGGKNTFTPVPFNFTSSQMEGECSNTYSATFSYMFDMDWNSTVIRCKIDTGDVLGGSSLYVDRKVLIIPGNICNIYNAVFVPHPYSCGQYLWCADRIYMQQCASTLCHLTVPINTTEPCGYCNGCIDSF